MSRFWVGGATGFLGSHLVRVIKDAGHDVVAVSRSGGEVYGQEVHPVDVMDTDAVQASAMGCDGAFLATGRVSRDDEDAQHLYQLHVLGTRSALSALRRAEVHRVVYASTSGVIAISKKPRVFKESDPTPLELVSRWPYYRTKLYAEREALEANSPPDFEVVAVNPSLLFGPGDTRNSSTNDIRKFLERGFPATPAGGLAFVDARDAAQAMYNAFERGRAGERYLLSAYNMTVRALFDRLERISGVKAPALNVPKSTALAIFGNELLSKVVEKIGGEPPVDSGTVEMGQHFWYCDSSKAEAELGFAPRDATDTLRDTIDYIRSAGRPRAKANSIAVPAS